MRVFILCVLAGCSIAPAWCDFPTVMGEPNLEKRSELALREADNAISAARKAYEEKQAEEFRSRISDAEQLVALSYKSLQDTGKPARNKPKYFKRAEMAIRILLRRLTSFEAEVALDDRAGLSAARKSINDVHDHIVHDIMTKK